MKRFSNSSSSIIIAAISIALIGLSWAQVRLVYNSIELSDQLFSQQVHEALSNVARKLEDVEHVADAVMISSKQHEMIQEAEQPKRRRPSIKKTEEKKTDSVMARAQEGTRFHIGQATLPTAVPNSAPNSLPTSVQSTRPNQQSVVMFARDNSQQRLVQSSPLTSNCAPNNAPKQHRQATNSDKVQTDASGSASPSMRVDIRQANGSMEFRLSSDEVSTLATSEQPRSSRRPVPESPDRVRSWDSVIKQLSGNVSARFIDVQDDLNQTILQLQKEQFFLRQNSPTVSFGSQSGLQTSIGFLVDGSQSLNALKQQGGSSYSVAVGEPSAMQHTRLTVPVLHKAENCDHRNCTVCSAEANDSSCRNSPEHIASVECTKRIQNKINLIQQTVQDLREFSAALEERVNQMMIDSMISSEFSTKSLPLDYGFGVMNGENSRFVYAKNGSSEELAASPYKSVLFSGDIVPKNHKLFVTFPTKQSYIVKKNAGILSFSALFMVMIIGSFGWTMRNLNRHKKVSEMKSDFINNMTHEFKTPIATIALAADALRDPEVNSSGERVGRFIGVIREENQRLGSQVERVLQAAKLDRGELALSRTDVDLHELIGVTKDSITLQVDARGGIITSDLRAEFPAVFGDEMHLRNVMLNLLDNANKYTSEKPIINITTRNINNGVMISVSDNGIGISKESQKRIFEKLYRVPTGNVHNVKGFGLGLSYVKAIVEAHGGFVNVESEIGRGSRFDVFLPFGIAS